MSAVISCETETLLAKSIDKEAAFSDLLHLIKVRRNDFQKLSHVPRDVVNAMKRAGIFRASTPKRFGGDALPAADFLKMVERIAEADGSAGWVAAFGSANTYLAALPLETQAMIYADGPDQVYGGGLYPIQPAQRVHGGWKVSGRWRFASGCKCADWLSVGIGAAGPNGMAGKPLAAVLPASRVEIIDNWDVVGMQGTGSHDLQLHNEFVADEWTFVRGGAVTVDEPIFRYPAVALQAQVHAAVNLGLAKAALEILIEMGGVGNATQGTSKLADRSYYRIDLGRAQAQYLSARAFYYEATESAWDVLARGDELTLQQTNRVRLAATNAAHTCADVINSAYKLAGMSAIFNNNRRRCRIRGRFAQRALSLIFSPPGAAVSVARHVPGTGPKS
jgi:alkylation response protein AidB-like acyl-CoA dehydrogenase